MATFNDVITQFLEGKTEGQSSGQGNLKIRGEVLIHYFTPILQRYGERYILNMTRYSLVTGKLQKAIAERIPKEHLLIVKRVPEGYKGSLIDFIQEENERK